MEAVRELVLVGTRVLPAQEVGFVNIRDQVAVGLYGMVKIARWRGNGSLALDVANVSPLKVGE